ncbi:MAG: DUF1552 domain-containing protein [Polyangiales bacterium]
MPKPLSRRTLLRGAAGAAVALPFLEAMLPKRASAATFPKRFIGLYTPCGTIPKNFWPSGTENSWEPSEILTPLAAHKADLLVLGGLDNLASLDGPGDAHQRGTGSSLTGAPLMEGEFVGMGGAVAGWGSATSIDQVVAGAIAGNTTFKSLEFGVGVIGSHVGTRISYADAARPNPPENSPYSMYKRLFGDPNANASDRDRKNMRRQLVLGLVNDEAKRLRARLGQADREKLDAHLDAISAVEGQLTRPTVEFGGNCQPLDLGAEKAVYDSKNYPAIGDLQMQLMALAFACDITRVSTLMWTYAASPIVYGWVDAMNGAKSVPIKDGHHTIAHKGDEQADYVAQNTAINTWHASKLAYLIDLLKGIDEGDGTVFSNSSILWTNEQSTGNNHSREDMPYILAGTAGGAFNSGRYVRYTPKPADRAANQRGEPHNKLLVSIANAYGVETDVVGSGKYGKGALPNLT